MTSARRLLAIAALAAPLALTACGGTSTSGTTPSGNTDLTVLGFDSRFDRTSYSVTPATAGQVSIEFISKGNLVHDLLIEGQSFKMSVAPGDKRTATATLPKGTYTIYCDIPGHRSQGMQATLTVN